MRLGLGTTQFWTGAEKEAVEVFLAAYHEYGINVIDTAEMYGSGECERAVSGILKSIGRDNIYLIDKILPENATEEGFMNSLHRSLDNLQTDCIDLYLLHWRENADLNVVVEKMEEARKLGFIKQWGVSNFDVADMEDLLKVRNGDRCYANQIFYNVFYRGVEFDLLPYLDEHDIMPISYSTLDTRASLNRGRENPEMKRLCQQTGLCLEALLLAFATRKYDLLALFKTTSLDHLRDNLKCLDFDISPYMDIIDRCYPAPTEKVPMEKR
ncbi:MAG: aldo/keto reductase [Erysipelotrichaceae bacterium]|nr:aldo/keto reductase [Erysipelotrichaceae bacterium]